MAKRIVDEEMRFSIVINGNEAQKELFDLEKATKELSRSNKELNAEKTRLKALGKQESEEYKKITASIKENNAAISTNKSRMKVLQDQIGLTGLTMRQLSQRASQLKLQMHNMVPGSAEYKRLQADLVATDARMKELRMSARATQSTMGRLADTFNKYQSIVLGVVATVTGFIFSIQQMIDYNGKLSDAMSNVRKTTSMTRKEVEDLTKSFGAFETRTSRIDHLKIAEEGGRIGIAKEEIGEFVEVMNKASVALGDSFTGGVEEVASSLGKLKLLYAETRDIGVEEAYMAIGSAINDLGAAGVATEKNIAEFATRVGSLPAAIKPSIGEALALGAAFEESGIKAEIAGRGYNILITGAAENASKFAKVMGLTTKEVEDFINEDPLDFLIRFAKGMDGMNAIDTANTLKYLGINADGATKIIGALANNTELFTETIDLSNQSMIDATSLITEYDIKNNNLAATIDKVGKHVRAAFSSDTVVNFLATSINWFAKFIGASEDASGGVTRFREALVFLLKIIAVTGAAILSYNAAIKLTALLTTQAWQSTVLYNTVQKVSAFVTNLVTMATLAANIAYYKYTGNVVRATAAQRLFNTAVKLNPWGLLLGAITAIVVAYAAFKTEAKEAATAQSMLNKAMADAQVKTAGQAEKLRTLQEVAEDVNASEETRKKAIEAINRIVPDYNKNLDLSTKALKAGKTTLDLYIDSLQRQAEAQFLSDQVMLKSKELKEAENSNISKHIKWYEGLWNSIKAGGQAYQTINNNIQTGIKNREKNIKLIELELEAAKKAYKEYVNLNPDTIVTEEEFVTTFTPVNPDDPAPDGTPKADNLKKEQEELRRLIESNAKLRASLISEEFKRELALEDVNHQAKLTQIREQMADEATLRAAAPDVKDILLAKNRELNQQIEYEESLHQNRIGVILQKAIADKAKQDQEAFDRETVQLETAHNLEMAALGDDEEAKARLHEKYLKDAEERQRKHLEKMIAQMKEILSSVDYEGMNLELLPEAEKEKFLAWIEEANLKLSALLNKLNKSKQDTGGEANYDGDVDVLGFSIDQWDEVFENLDTTKGKLELAGMAVQSLMQGWGMYSDFMAQRERQDLANFEAAQRKKEERLKRQLDSGYINQRQYNAAVDAMEKETRKKRAEMEYKQAKREKEMAIAGIALNTAVAVAKTLAQGGFILGIPWAAIVGALGAVQLGMAMAMPLPAKGFEQGLYPVQREQDGKMFKAKFGGKTRTGLVNQPTVFMAGEGRRERPEMIIDGDAFHKLNPDVKNSLYRELGRMGRVPGYEGGYYPEMKVVNRESESGSSGDYALFAAALNRNSAVMERIEQQGIKAFLDRSLENAKKIDDDIKEYHDLRNANKI